MCGGMECGYEMALSGSLDCKPPATFSGSKPAVPTLWKASGVFEMQIPGPGIVDSRSVRGICTSHSLVP